MTVSDTHWAARLSDYNDATAVMREFDQGEWRRVNDADGALRARLAETYGSLDLARANPIGGAVFDASYKEIERIEAASERLEDVKLDALFALMLTPAPNMDAVLTKIALAIEFGDYDELIGKPEPALESILRDLEALTKN